ncbi:MAG TPA: serine hydrolase [Terracidiphilus sp.]|nr:serine hydrolase [Terracidiphilus sp.]
MRAHGRVAHSLSWLLFAFTVALPGIALRAQKSSTQHLADYAGTYRDQPGHTIEIVDGDGLFAVVDDAKYPLRPVGKDLFLTVSGETVPFVRDAKGNVTGYEQYGSFHPRISAYVSPESRALARPRPKGQDAPADYHYHPPADLHDGIAVGDITHTALGVATANTIVHAILDGTYKDVHSVLLYQNGKLVMEEYFYGYNAQRTNQLRSATKSVVSTLAGIAIDRGALAGVQEHVLPLLHYSIYEHPDPRKAMISLSDLLSMSSGLDCNDHSSTSPGRETVLDNAPDWVKATLDLQMIHDPGSQGFYCSGGVAVVGRVTENAVHQKLPDFAQDVLFGPLGIPRSNWTWNYDLTNHDKEYSQIHMRPRDMLKLGILFEDKGLWHGRRVLSASWVRTATAEHSHVENVSYGYFWWRHRFDVKTPGGVQQTIVIAAQGNGGQKIYIAPQFGLVAVFTGGRYNAESTPPNTIMERIILPKLMNGATSPMPVTR